MIVISVDIRETRVALIENGIIAELHIERRGHTTGGSTVGSVYLGKVTRVLPGLQAAFIDIGQERAAFLHVEDLIRPDDFETYLAGGRKHARGSEEEEVPTAADAEEENKPLLAEVSAVETPPEPELPSTVRSEPGPPAEPEAEKVPSDAPTREALPSDVDAEDLEWDQ